MITNNKIVFMLCLSSVFLTNCINEFEDEKPDIVHKIESWSALSDSVAVLELSVISHGQDSLTLNFYLESKINQLDTLYHSSSFPLFIAFKENEELTPPFKDQVFFDDLVYTALPPFSNQMIRQIKIEQYEADNFHIVGVFNFSTNKDRTSSYNNWIISKQLIIK